MFGDYKLFIGGKLVDGAATMDVVNPATEEVLAACPRASAAQLDAAVAAANAAFPAWSSRAIGERRALLLQLADAVMTNEDALARLLTSEQGKPLPEAKAEVAYTAHFIREIAALDLTPRILEDSAVRRVEQHRKPLGVVAAIIPWNFPLLVVAFKLPAALLAGNCLIVKPAPTTPLATLRLGELCASIFPPGVVNVVTDQNDLGQLLCEHPGVAKVSFTGSTATGRKVMAAAAATIKRVTLELGGNDAAIVLPGADPAAVAPGLFQGAFLNAGQVCLAIKRVYAHDSIYDALCDELGRLADAAIVDDGLAQGAQIGPVQNRMQYEKLKALLLDARRDGTIVAGGAAEDRPGYFIRPTIVRDVEDGSRLVDEEQFGPILPVLRYADPEDALRRANDSPYGLGGSVWGAEDDAVALAARMEAGTVWVNKHLDFGPLFPLAGAKQSGLGIELGEDGLAEFTQSRILNRSALVR